MSGRGDARESLQESVSRGVQELVGDAEDSALANGFEVVPVSLGDDSLQWDSGTGSAPGEEENVGIGCGDLL